MVSYMDVHFGFGPKTIFDSFFMANQMGNFVAARMIYRGCMLFSFHRKILVDLVELDKVNFDDLCYVSLD